MPAVRFGPIEPDKEKDPPIGGEFVAEKQCTQEQVVQKKRARESRAVDRSIDRIVDRIVDGFSFAPAELSGVLVPPVVATMLDDDRDRCSRNLLLLVPVAMFIFSSWRFQRRLCPSIDNTMSHPSKFRQS